MFDHNWTQSLRSTAHMARCNSSSERVNPDSFAAFRRLPFNASSLPNWSLIAFSNCFCRIPILISEWNKISTNSRAVEIERHTCKFVELLHQFLPERQSPRWIPSKAKPFHSTTSIWIFVSMFSRTQVLPLNVTGHGLSTLGQLLHRRFSTHLHRQSGSSRILILLSLHQYQCNG